MRRGTMTFSAFFIHYGTPSHRPVYTVHLGNATLQNMPITERNNSYLPESKAVN